MEAPFIPYPWHCSVCDVELRHVAITFVSDDGTARVFCYEHGEQSSLDVKPAVPTRRTTPKRKLTVVEAQPKFF